MGAEMINADQLDSLLFSEPHPSCVINRATIKFLRFPCLLCIPVRMNEFSLPFSALGITMLSHDLSVSLNRSYNPGPNNSGFKPGSFASFLKTSIDCFLYDCSLKRESPTQFFIAMTGTPMGSLLL